MILMNRIFDFFICLLFHELSITPVPIYHLFFLYSVIVFVLLYCILCHYMKFLSTSFKLGGSLIGCLRHIKKGEKGECGLGWPHPLTFACSVACCLAES